MLSTNNTNEWAQIRQAIRTGTKTIQIIIVLLRFWAKAITRTTFKEWKCLISSYLGVYLVNSVILISHTHNAYTILAKIVFDMYILYIFSHNFLTYGQQNKRTVTNNYLQANWSCAQCSKFNMNVINLAFVEFILSFLSKVHPIWLIMRSGGESFDF